MIVELPLYCRYCSQEEREPVKATTVLKSTDAEIAEKADDDTRFRMYECPYCGHKLDAHNRDSIKDILDYLEAYRERRREGKEKRRRRQRERDGSEDVRRYI